MLRLRPFLPLLACALASGACDDDPATAVVVATSADQGVRARVDAVVITAQRGGRTWTQRYLLAPLPQVSLPGTLTFHPENLENIPGEPLSVRVAGVSGQQEIVARSARMNFIKGRTKLLRLGLSSKCFPEIDPCKGLPGKVCDDGKCVDEQVDLATLPDFATNEEATDPQQFPGLGGSGGSGGSGDPCAAVAPLSVAVTGAPQGQLAADAPFQVDASATGGSGVFRYELSTTDGELITAVEGGAAATLGARAELCEKSFRVRVTDLTCPSLAPAVQALPFSVGLGTWVVPCEPSTAPQCGTQQRPWCTILRAQQALGGLASTQPGGVTLRLASGGDFSGPVDMAHKVHLQGGYPADFSSETPVDGAPLPTIVAPPGSEFTVRWGAADAVSPLLADLRRVRVQTPAGALPDTMYKALWAEGLATATLQGVEVLGTGPALPGQGAALALSGKGAQLTLDACSLDGPPLAPASAGLTLGVWASGEELSLQVQNGQIRGGTVAQAADPGNPGRAVGILFEGQGSGALNVTGATVVGSLSASGASATGLRLDSVAVVSLAKATLRGGDSSLEATGVELSGAPPTSFSFVESTAEGLLSGAGEGRGLRLSTLVPPPDGEIHLTLQSPTLRGATGGAAPLAVGLDLAWSTPSDNPSPAALFLSILDAPQIIGASGGNATIAKGILLENPYIGAPVDELIFSDLSLTRSHIEGGLGSEERLGVWAVDSSLRVVGGSLRGSTAPGGKRVVGADLRGYHRAAPAELLGAIDEPLIIEGGQGQDLSADDVAENIGLTVDGAGLLTVQSATVRGCSAAGCQSRGGASGIRLDHVTSASITGCDIEAGSPSTPGGPSEAGEAIGVWVGPDSILGQVVIENNPRIVGGGQLATPLFQATGIRLEGGPVQLLNNADIRGGFARTTLGVNAELPVNTPDAGARFAEITGNTIAGGEGLDVTGLRVVGFVGSHLWNNRIDGGGTPGGPCDPASADFPVSRGVALGWLPDSYFVNNRVFGGRACEAVACDIDTLDNGNAVPTSQAQLFAHNLCLAPGRPAGLPGSRATGLRARHGGLANTTARQLYVVGNILAVGPSAPSQGSRAQTRVAVELQTTGPQGPHQFDHILLPSNRLLLFQPSPGDALAISGTDALPFDMLADNTVPNANFGLSWTGTKTLDPTLVAFVAVNDGAPLSDPSGYLIGAPDCSASGLLYSYSSTLLGPLSINGDTETLAYDAEKQPRPDPGLVTAGPDECGSPAQP